jgi:hypothetical protein
MSSGHRANSRYQLLPRLDIQLSPLPVDPCYQQVSLSGNHGCVQLPISGMVTIISSCTVCKLPVIERISWWPRFPALGAHRHRDALKLTVLLGHAWQDTVVAAVHGSTEFSDNGSLIAYEAHPIRQLRGTCYTLIGGQLVDRSLHTASIAA